MIVETERPKKRGRPKKISSMDGQNFRPLGADKVVPPVKTGTSAKPDAAVKTSAGTKSKCYVVIDYPQEGDKFYPHHYSVRIGAGGGDPVEISMDGGDWIACRLTAGYYWYDWHSIASGKHKIAARIKLPDGKYKKSKAVRCEVY